MVDDINLALPLRTLNYGNDGLFLIIMGHAGFGTNKGPGRSSERYLEPQTLEP